jgi:predicted nuclease of predicted toxin-antitoxin system
MKVLIDQNISYRIVPQIESLFDFLTHVKFLGWIDWNDHDIFMTARDQKYDAVITLDEDFNKLLLQHGTPPKIIWIKTGNCSTSKLVEVITTHGQIILDFLSDDTYDCLELYG